MENIKKSKIEDEVYPISMRLTRQIRHGLSCRVEDVCRLTMRTLVDSCGLFYSKVS